LIATLLATLALAASPAPPAGGGSPAKARSARPAASASQAVAGAPSRATATPGPAAPPVRVDAAEVRYAFQRREVTFTGKPVTLTREDARLTCTRLVAKNDQAGEIATATCEGDVRLVRGERVVTCRRGVYENATARVTCEGDAVLRDRGSEARADRAVYELKTDEVRLESASGGPVRITLPGDEVEARRRELEQRRQQRAEERKR
jgi:lipopolysaccharide export system protein LptA